MHDINTLQQLNRNAERAQAERDVLQEARDNINLLCSAPQLTGYERTVLHYSRMIVRLAAGESFEHVAQVMGPAIDPNDGR